MRTNAFDYLRATTLDDALAAMAAGGDVRAAGGGVQVEKNAGPQCGEKNGKKGL